MFWYSRLSVLRTDMTDRQKYDNNSRPFVARITWHVVIVTSSVTLSMCRVPRIGRYSPIHFHYSINSVNQPRAVLLSNKTWLVRSGFLNITQTLRTLIWSLIGSLTRSWAFILKGYGPTTVWDARLSWSRTQRCSTRVLPRYEFCFQAFLFVKFPSAEFFFHVRLEYDVSFCFAKAVIFAGLILW